MEKRSFVITFAAILIILNFIFVTNISNSPITFSLDNPQNYTYSNTNIIEINSEQASAGYATDIARGDIINLPIEGEQKNIQLLDVDSSNNAALIKIGSENILLKAGEAKKICTNNNGFYELSLILDSASNNGANLKVQTINEEISTSSAIEDAIGRLQASSRKQFYLFLLNMTLIILGVLAYLFFTRVKPELKMRKIRERESSSEALDIFLIELKKAAKSNDKKRIKDIEKKVKNFYKYFSKEDKRKAKKKIDEIAKFLK